MLSHFDESGAARMVDVGQKAVTERMARASVQVRMLPATMALVRDRRMSRKGDVLEVARLAGIMAAKRTGELIPLCHPLPLDSITVEFELPDDSANADVIARSLDRAIETTVGLPIEAGATRRPSVEACAG